MEREREEKGRGAETRRQTGEKRGSEGSGFWLLSEVKRSSQGRKEDSTFQFLEEVKL